MVALPRLQVQDKLNSVPGDVVSKEAKALAAKLKELTDSLPAWFCPQGGGVGEGSERETVDGSSD